MKRRIRIAVAFTLAISLAPCYGEEPATQLLEKGIYQEQTVGDLSAALEIFHRIVRQHEQIESIAAEARLHIGLIHLKQGHHEQATEALQKLADTYPGKASLLRRARGKMPPVIDDAIEQIRTHYVDEFDSEQELTEAALRGVLGNLDRFSTYLDAKTVENMHISIDGRVVGIGARLDTKGGNVSVTAPIPGSPARTSGLKAGDRIVSVDGTRLDSFPEGQRLLEAVKRIRGKAGTAVELQVIDSGSEDPRTVRITRGEIQLPSVTGTRRDDSDVWNYRLPDSPEIAYVRVSNLTKRSPMEVQRAVNSLGDQPVKGLILDVRGNGGGILSSAVEVADMFLAEGKILEVRGRKDDDQVFKADATQVLAGVPMVALVDRNTASAAEILVGALKDLDRATVIGQRTFGKGTVQGLFPLKSGGAIKLTTARFYLPSGANLEKPIDADADEPWGVRPSEGMALSFSDEELADYTKHRSAIELFGKPDATQQGYRDRGLEKAIAHLIAP